MATEIRAVFPNATVELVPGGKGDFIVVADGKSLWNKREAGRFPETGEIVPHLKDD